MSRDGREAEVVNISFSGPRCYSGVPGKSTNRLHGTGKRCVYWPHWDQEEEWMIWGVRDFSKPLKSCFSLHFPQPQVESCLFCSSSEFLELIHFFEFSQTVKSRHLGNPTFAQTSLRQNITYKTGLDRVLELGGLLFSCLLYFSRGSYASWKYSTSETTVLRLGKSGFASDTILTANLLTSPGLNFLNNKIGILLLHVAMK